MFKFLNIMLYFRHCIPGFSPIPAKFILFQALINCYIAEVVSKLHLRLTRLPEYVGG
jgi:hypothetical protein